MPARLLKSIAVAVVLIGIGVWAGLAFRPGSRPAEPVPAENPRPGQPGHVAHEEWQGDFPTVKTQKDFKVLGSIKPPRGFLGNMAYDPDSGRLWLVSLGPPTNRQGPSTIYEVDPGDGRILAQAELPFRGDFGQPVYIDGHLYQGIFHESKMYKIDVRPDGEFGAIVATIPLPTLNDLKLVNEAHPFPFIEFGGVAATPDKNIILHADDVGEFITVERDTGRILHRVRSLKALGGIAATTDRQGTFLVLGNSDPRGGYCALSYPPEISRSPEQRDISWALLDGRTGEVLASIRRQFAREYASTVTLVDREDDPEHPYGRFTFLAMGEEGILKLSWAPSRDAY